jgi:peptidoglycan/xylan/chitin deacetylase (PgdA/CDA1 family)
MLLRLLFRNLSPAGGRAKLSIFIFHRVLADPDPLLPWEPDARQFDWMIRFIARTYAVLPLGDAIKALERGSLPAAPAVITFDDGYLDNLTVAAPILNRYQIPATFFIATAFLNGGRMWNDDIIEAFRHTTGSQIDLQAYDLGRHCIETRAAKIAAYGAVLGRLKYFSHERRSIVARQVARQAGVSDVSKLMMTIDQVKELRSMGMEIGGHTRTHPILERLSDEAAEDEIAGGRDELEAALREKITVFAYPNGLPGKDYSPRHASMARRLGFSGAVSTVPGVALAGTDIFNLPRFTPWHRTPAKFAAQSLKTLFLAH